MVDLSCPPQNKARPEVTCRMFLPGEVAKVSRSAWRRGGDGRRGWGGGGREGAGAVISGESITDLGLDGCASIMSLNAVPGTRFIRTTG